MVWDGVLVDGTDISTATRFEEDRDGHYEMPPQRGELPTYPGLDGEKDVDQPFGPTVFQQHLVLNTASYTAANDEFRTLRRLCKPGRTVTLTKKLAYTSGNESYTATAKLRTIARSRVNPVIAKCLVEWTILDGLWYASTVTEAVAFGSTLINVTGDVRTQRMTITLPGGVSAPTLTNVTNGYWLRFGGTAATPTVIDVEAMTAIRGGIDVSYALTWGETVPFRLEPGINGLSLDSGTASVTYSPAFL